MIVDGRREGGGLESVEQVRVEAAARAAGGDDHRLDVFVRDTGLPRAVAVGVGGQNVARGGRIADLQGVYPGGTIDVQGRLRGGGADANAARRADQELIYRRAGQRATAQVRPHEGAVVIGLGGLTGGKTGQPTGRVKAPPRDGRKLAQRLVLPATAHH